MYLIIFEDGTIGKTKELSEDNFIACDAGLIYIIDMDVSIANPESYYNGEWHPIEDVYI